MDLDAIFSPNPHIVAGGAALGDMLTGGPGQRAQVAYVDQYQKNAKAADAMWQARDNRARAIAREGLSPDTLQQAGYPADKAPLLANVLAAGATPNLRNLGEYADPAAPLIDAERADALKRGDAKTYNQLTALTKDREYQPTRVTGGVMMEDGAGLGDKVVPLPQTQATIDERHASTDRTRAQIGNDALRTGAYVDKQHRAPAPRSHKPAVDPDTTMAWITAKATELAKSGKPDAYVQAFIHNEAAKAGIDLDSSSVEAPGSTGSVAVPEVAGRSPAKQAWTPAEVGDALAAGRAAIKSGKLTVKQVRERLLSQGLSHAAAQIK